MALPFRVEGVECQTAFARTVRPDVKLVGCGVDFTGSAVAARSLEHAIRRLGVAHAVLRDQPSSDRWNTLNVTDGEAEVAPDLAVASHLLQWVPND